MIRPLLGQDVDGTGIDELSLSNTANWRVFPNPANDDITIEIPSDNQVNYTILNVQGQKMLNGITERGQSISIRDIPSGLYFVRLADGMTAYGVQKIIKK
jgi:hypothetical protein